MGAWAPLAQFIGYAITGVLVLIAGVVTWKIFTNRINLDRLIAEADGKASLSRFQFLIFTFVVAGVFLLLSIESGTFVDIPNNVLWLLGISGGSYVVSKGIVANAKKSDPDMKIKGEAEKGSDPAPGP